MSFLEECRKAEHEDWVGKTKSKGKVKIAAATASSSVQHDAFAKQLKRQQQQPQGHNSQPNITHPQQEQGNVKTYIGNQCWQCGEMGHLKRSCPMLKGKGLFQGGNA